MKDMKTISVKGRKIGKDKPVFIVAEISSNHGGDFQRAVKMIKAAKECGADAVKFQVYRPDRITVDCRNKIFRVNHPRWGGQTLIDLYKKTYTPWTWFKKLKKISENLGLVFFATAFHESAVDFLEELKVPLHKIASFELVDTPLIRYMAKTKKPLIISTGMGSLSEIKEAVSSAKKSGVKDIILLKCASSYPANPEYMNLKVIPDMRRRFGCNIGFSDHSLGMASSIAASCLGACVIEKHFTLSRKLKTPDNFFSMEPRELRELVINMRTAEKAVGKASYVLSKEERKSKKYRRSLFAIKDIKKGESFSWSNIRSVRPGDGLKPKYIRKVLGRKASGYIKKGTPIRWGLIK